MNQGHARKGRQDHSLATGKSVVIVGAGGTIGSHLAPHIGRMARVGVVTLIDHDRYEARNMNSQEIEARDVGKRKVDVQGRRIRRINRQMAIRTIAKRVEDVPLGVLRGDIILACLDSRKARMTVNEAAWRLGVPWSAAGIGGDDWIARVNAYLPDEGSPCMECTWNNEDYAAIEQSYPCDGGADRTAPTNAPSHLGAMAAAIQAAECEKMLADSGGVTLVSRQLVVEMRNQGQIISRETRNPNCRFDHRILDIRPVKIASTRVSVGELLQTLRSSGGGGERAIELPGHTFVKSLVCRVCQRESSRRLRIARRLTDRESRCSACGGRMIARGFDQVERVRVDQLENSDRLQTLQSVGLRDGDVLGISEGHEVMMVELKLDHREKGGE